MRRAFANAWLALVAAVSAPAAAQDVPPGEVAVPEPAPPPPSPEPPPPPPPLQVAGPQPEPQPEPPPAKVAAPEEGGPAILSPRLTGGLIAIDGRQPGGFGRWELEAILVYEPDEAGPILAVWDALEFWGAPGAGGFAIPYMVSGGYQSPALLLSAGLGFNLFTYDREDGEGGAGILSPRACARLGVRLGMFYAGIEAEGQRRWRWNLADRWMAQVGLAIGVAPVVR